MKTDAATSSRDELVPTRATDHAESPPQEQASPGEGPEMPGEPQQASDERLALRWVRPAVRVVVWVFVNLTILLSTWVGIGWLIGGWTPVVITSGSMEPALSVGDVLLIDRTPDEAISQRAIIVFGRDGETIAHRVFAIEGGEYVTRGDANPTPDAGRITDQDVIGTGRLVVPVIGLPIVWLHDGARLPLAAWAVLTVAGVVGLARAGDAWWNRLRARRKVAPAASQPVGRRAIQRVRNLIAVLIVAQFVTSPGRFDAEIGRSRAIVVVVGAVLILLAMNLLSSSAERRHGALREIALVELALDTALVVVLVTVTGTNSFSWVLFSLPIVEAAVRFRLAGALVHWMLLTFVALASKVWFTADEAAAVTLDSLEALLDQLSVIFLVVVPAAYLAEHLLSEVVSWQRATGQAVDRGQLLVRVADTGRDITRIDSDRVNALVAGARSLGFDLADLVVEDSHGGWTRAGGDALPSPGTAASCTRHGDLDRGGAYVTEDDPDPAEAEALRAAGLCAVLAHIVSEGGGRRVVLRAAVTDRRLTNEMVEAFSLLAGQASVALRNEELVNEITEVYDELEHQALHDALTGLPNRTLLLGRLGELRAQLVAPVLLFLDLDRFKPVNDRLGHDAGDELLQQVAERLRTTAPDGATVARLGGDEFTVLLPGVSEPDAMLIASRIVHDIRQPFVLGSETVSIGTSIGIALGGPEVDDAELIRRADVAMYDAKQDDAAEFRVYHDALDLAASRRAALLRDLGTAIEDGSVYVRFQPVFDVAATPRVVGAEALLRWTHPTFGEVAPPEIVETARAAQLQRQLHRHVIRTSCEQAVQWSERHQARRPFVAVNASPDELGAPTLVEDVLDALVDTGLPAERLYVEISERLVTPAPDAVVDNVEALRAMGVGLLLDDFGQGSTSLSALQDLPLAGIKIDRRLVVNAERSVTDREVLQSIVSLSSRLGLLVIAEGVETNAHLAEVIGAGCRLAQGFHLATPLTPPELERLLAGELPPSTNLPPLVPPSLARSLPTVPVDGALSPRTTTPTLDAAAPEAG